MPLTVGGTIHGRYTVVSVLGEGAMSTVYLVSDRHGPARALKAFEPRGGTPDEMAEARQLFLQEIELLRSVDHPFIPRVHDVFSDFFVMDYIEGRTLETIVDRNGPAPEAYVLPIAIQLLRLLSWLHVDSRGPIVFRDLKPSNVMVDYEGRVHLIDFGAARLWKVGQAADTVPLGTPGFAAPEQYGVAQSGPSTDIYAWAATIYRTLTAVDPDPAGTRAPVRTLAPDCSVEMERILDRCLRTDASERFQSAEQVLDALIGLQKAQFPEVEATKPPAAITGPSTASRVGSVVLNAFLILFILFILLILVTPFGRMRARPQGEATACKSNLKNIGTALEMYSTDNKGAFPKSLALLTPNYLKAVPSCPSASSVTYLGGYAVSAAPDRYTVVCSGNFHPGVGYSQNYPQYTSTDGLLER